MMVNRHNTRPAFRNAADTDIVVKTRAVFYMQPCYVINEINSFGRFNCVQWVQYYFRIFTNTVFRLYNLNMWTRCKYWPPRLIILGFAVSMVMPAPKFIVSMEDAEFVVWML